MNNIEKMIEGIPLEELTGGAGLNINKEKSSFAVIPDIPAAEEILQNEGKTEYISEEEVNVKEAEKPVKIKSKALGVLAAVLALVIGAGGILVYMGAAKKTGPMASMFNSSKTETVEENRNAKLVFTAVSACIANLIADGEFPEIPTGKYIIDLSDISGLDPKLRKIAEIIKLDLEKNSVSGGEAAFYIDPFDYMPTVAQWRESEGSTVEQYPAQQEGIVFGELDKYIYEPGVDENGDINVVFGCKFIYFSSEYYDHSTEKTIISRDEADKLYNALAEREICKIDENAPKVYGPMYYIVFKHPDHPETYRIEISDDPGAPLKINNEYCTCETAERILKEHSITYSSGTVISDDLTESEIDGQLRSDLEEKAKKWYEDFLKAEYEPVTDVGESTLETTMRYAELKGGDTTATIVNTHFTKANVQVNGKYYMVEDTSIFDIIDENYADHTAQEKNETEDVSE